MNKLSIIIPVYRNEDTLKDLYYDLKEKVFQKTDDYEVVFVNDGSDDNSWNIIQELQKEDSKIVAVNLSKNFGEHAGILAGLEICTGDCAVTKQADLQEDSTLIVDMYNVWRTGKKVVLAARRTRQDGFFTKFFAGLYYIFVRKCINKKMPKGGCDCFLIDRQVITTILNLDEINSSLILQILWTGYDSQLVYFDRQKREKGKGAWTFAKKIKLVMDSFIGFSYIPIKIVWFTGLLFLLFSFYLGTSILIEYCKVGINVNGWASIMCLILICTGFILLFLGILGEYIWRIYDETRNRPIYIIDKIIKK